MEAGPAGSERDHGLNSALQLSVRICKWMKLLNVLAKTVVEVCAAEFAGGAEVTGEAVGGNLGCSFLLEPAGGYNSCRFW